MVADVKSQSRKLAHECATSDPCQGFMELLGGSPQLVEQLLGYVKCGSDSSSFVVIHGILVWSYVLLQQ